MLLLLLDLELHPFTLGSLFKISIGVIEDRYDRTYVKDNTSKKVWFLHMGDMDSNNRKIDFANLELKEKELLDKRLNRTENKLIAASEKMKKPLIPDSKFLMSYDYLISCRGKKVGYSMLSENQIENVQIEHNSSNIVPTHHFLVLRPRDTTIDIRYLHFLLDLLIKYKLDPEYKESILSKSHIEDIVLNISGNPLKQKEYMDELGKLRDEETSVQHRITKYIDDFFIDDFTN